MAKKSEGWIIEGLFSRKDALSLVGALALGAVAAYLFLYYPVFRHLGYIGIFLVSLLSSATVLLPLPGFVLVFGMGATLNPLLVGLVAGIGSGLGELTGYLAGYAGHDALLKTKLYKAHRKGITSLGPIAIFFLAAIPNPAFDIAGIASGAIKMPWWQFLAATILGKSVRYILLAYAGSYAFGHWLV